MPGLILVIDLFQRRSRSGNTSPDLVGGSRVGVNSLITEARLMALDPGPISFASKAKQMMSISHFQG